MKQDSILAYLTREGVKIRPADPVAIAEYERSMREECIPAIEAAMKRQAKLAAEFRHKVLFR